MYLKLPTMLNLNKLILYFPLDQKSILKNTEMARITTLYNLEVLEDINIVQKEKVSYSIIYSNKRAIKTSLYSVVSNSEILFIQ
ncbi:hypothetical protein [Candidatus Lokiarchaeum ossiferum]